MKKGRKPSSVELQLSALIGDPLEIDPPEVESAFEELAGPSDVLGAAKAMAQGVAKQSRLANRPVPDHVQSFLKGSRVSQDLDEAPRSVIENYIEAALKPFRGPVSAVAMSYRSLTHKSAKDQEMLDRIANKVREDWDGEADDDRSK